MRRTPRHPGTRRFPACRAKPQDPVTNSNGYLPGASRIPPLNTEHALIDSEHRAVLVWAQEGAKRLREARPAEESLYAVDVLAHLARSHFAHEQIEMRASGHPHWIVHGQDHERRLAQLAQMRQLIVKAAEGAAQWPARERLTAWMLSHIAGHDRRYARWLCQREPLAAGAPQL
jgi:hemerythrin-like metal-binding protein